MAVSWLTLAKAVPWSDVIEHAPSVVNAARKLLSKRKGAEDGAAPAAETGADVPVPPPETTLTSAEVAQQLRAARLEAAQLRSQLEQTQQLLQELAEQQARTLAQVEDNRAQLQRLRRPLVAVGSVAALALVLALGLLVKVVGG